MGIVFANRPCVRPSAELERSGCLRAAAAIELPGRKRLHTDFCCCWRVQFWSSRFKMNSAELNKGGCSPVRMLVFLCRQLVKRTDTYSLCSAASTALKTSGASQSKNSSGRGLAQL